MDENRFKLAREKYNKNDYESVSEVVDAVKREQVDSDRQVAKSFINDIESTILKRRQASYLKVLSLAEHYGVSMDWLAGRDCNPRYDPDANAVCKFTGLSDETVQVLHKLKKRLLQQEDWNYYYNVMVLFEWLMSRPAGLSGVIQDITEAASLWDGNIQVNDDEDKDENEFSLEDGKGITRVKLSARNSMDYFIHRAAQSFELALHDFMKYHYEFDYEFVAERMFNENMESSMPMYDDDDIAETTNETGSPAV